MIQVDVGSATMAVDAANARPNVTVGRQWISVHLTEGFISTETPPGMNKPAFHITAEVDVFVDTQAEVDDILNGKWIFNFIQVCRINDFETVWTGRTKNEGEVTLDTAIPPALPARHRVSLDSQTSTTPFVNTDLPVATVSRRPGPRIKVHVVCKMGDHPNARQVTTSFQNRATRSSNFLRSFVDDSDFVTVFVVRDDRRVVQPLAHLHWRLAYYASIKWLKRQARAELRSPLLQFDSFIAGKPSDAAVVAILANPVPPHTNDVLNEAARSGVLNHLNLQYSPDRSLLVPNDFFK